MPRAIAVVNPVSGLTDALTLRQKIEAHFLAAGWEIIIYETTGSEIVKDVVANYIQSSPDLVIAAGGDGTVSQVASGLAGTSIPMGIIATGTWNALARNLGVAVIPEDALSLLTGSHDIRVLDSLKVKGNHYLMNVSTGFSASMIKGTRRIDKRRFGFLAYGWNLILQLIGMRRRTYHLIIDGKHRKVRAREVMIVNAGLIGIGELPTRLNIQPDDGKIEVIAFSPRSIFGLLSSAWNILVGGKNRHPEYRVFNATKNINLRSKRQLDIQGDGEVIGSLPIEIELIPHALHVVVPKLGRAIAF